MAWKNGPGRGAFAVGAFSERETRRITVRGSPQAIKDLPKPVAPPFNTGVKNVDLLPGRRFRARGSNSATLIDVPSAYFDYLGDKGKALVKARGSLTVLHGSTATFQTADSILWYSVGDATAGTIALGTGPKDLSVNANAIAADPKGGYRPPNVLLDPAPGGGNSAKVAENRTVVGRVDTRAALGGPQLLATDTGIYLTIAPTIGTDGIRLAITTSVINHVGYADNGRPIVAKRAAATELTVPDGKELVLSGMVHETEIHENRRVPILGSLPLIGYLFGNEIKQMQRRLVVVAVKAARVNDCCGLAAEDSKLIERAKGNLPIRMPGVRFELRGDSFLR